MSSSVDLSLEPPSTYIFTIEQCTQNYKLNAFAKAMKSPQLRERFKADGRAVMQEYGLTEEEIDRIERRDWCSLVDNGGHLFAMTTIANAVGQSHLNIGADMCGEDWRSFEQSLPRDIDLLPGDID
ncbi:hypothetical protein ACVBEJ_00515 [Porticoccus sp. GXU_MW_L64]